MKFAISTALLLLLVGTSSSVFARQDKGQDKGSDEHSQAAKPAQQSKSAPQAKPAAHQQTQNAKPAQQQHTQAKTRPAASPKTQTQAKAQPKTEPKTQTQARAQQPSGNNGGYAHGRISNAHYSASFGSGHSFHVNQGEFNNHRFSYGGYSFGFIDPWPVGWGYSDNVYVVYSDGGYFMYDSVHPGLRISISIL